jgi:hypothetical protein
VPATPKACRRAGCTPMRSAISSSNFASNVPEHAVFAVALGQSVEQSPGQLLAILAAIADEDPGNIVLPRSAVKAASKSNFSQRSGQDALCRSLPLGAAQDGLRKATSIRVQSGAAVKLCLVSHAAKQTLVTVSNGSIAPSNRRFRRGGRTAAPGPKAAARRLHGGPGSARAIARSSSPYLSAR